MKNKRLIRRALPCLALVVLAAGCDSDTGTTSVSDGAGTRDTGAPHIADVTGGDVGAFLDVKLYPDVSYVEDISKEPEPDVGTQPGPDVATEPDPDAGTEPEPDVGTEPEPLDDFSFFVTSLSSLRELSGSSEGFGGDLSFGETGAGAGLRGADLICAALAEMSMPGASRKQWRAFLSVTADENGDQVDARDRIGDGPWYDRLGRLLSPSLSDLLNERPEGGNAAIRDDLPNEFGVPNHQPDPTQPEVDNHHMMTGSGSDGRLYSSSSTCRDWTTSDGSSSNGEPRVGLAWPRMMRGPGGSGGAVAEDWISELSEAGCAAGVNLVQGPNSPNDDTVGAGGGYGGFYCFALER